MKNINCSGCTFLLLAILLSAAASSHAQTKPSDSPKAKPGLNTRSSVRINYGYTTWNQDPKKVESAGVLMRDGATGKLVQIQLVETEPDSSIFSGLYSIQWQNMDEVKVEFFIPPQDLLNSAEGMKTLAGMIERKELRRKPFILRRTRVGQQAIDVFDTAEQARSAMKIARAEQLLATYKNKQSKVISESDADTARLAEEQKKREAIAKNMSERLRIEQVEMQKIADLKARFAALTPAEQVKRQKQAAVLASEGLEFFKNNKLPEAREKFEKARELDPNNHLFYFQYGVVLYKLEDANRSIVMLQLADGPTVNKIERDYFLALDFYKLKEYKNAEKYLDKVIATKDPALGITAQFYKGILHFEQRNWDEAQKNFQLVLDQSNDPKMDERAEAFVEQILRIRQFEAEKAKKWLLSFMIGEQYDTNVLAISDSSDTGTQTNSIGYRTLMTLGLKYRAIYEETHDWSISLDTVRMYTVDKDFKTAQTLTNADPFVVDLTFPYSQKGMVWGLGHKLDLTPGYESIWMSAEDNTNKVILSSYFLNTSNLFVMSDRWFATYTFDIRQDTSKLNSAVGDLDSSANKYKLGTTQMKMVSEDKTRIVIGDAAYTLNQAKGKSSTYARIDLGLTYIRPWLWQTSTNFKLAYFRQDYTQIDGGRLDNSYTLTAGLSRKLTESWNSGFSTSYNINSSSLAANTYKKFTALITLSTSVGL